MVMLVNFLAYQIGWFICILGAARGMPWAGTITAVGVVAWHLSRAREPRPELTLVLVAAMIGAAWDSLLPALGWVTYPNGMFVDGTAPHWMVALWMMFATTMNLSLRWMKRSLALAAALGAAGGPLSYWAGAELGALSFAPGREVAALAALTIGWGVLTPVLVQLARRWNGFAVEAAPSSALAMETGNA
jgi:hypothetical protein